MDKKCTKCKTPKSLDKFSVDKSHKDGYRSVCKSCIKEYNEIWYNNNITDISDKRKKRYQKNRDIELKKNKENRIKNGYKWNETKREKHKKDPRYGMYIGAKSRSKKSGIEFNITLDDIIVPSLCPILNIPLFTSNLVVSPNSPTIDRIDNDKGYIKGNIIIISFKANTIKNSATIDDIGRVYNFYKKIKNG